MGQIRLGTATFLTRHQKRSRGAAALGVLTAALVGVYAGIRLCAWWFDTDYPRIRYRSPLAGQGLFNGDLHLEFPVYIIPADVNWWIVAPFAAVVVALVLRLVVVPVYRNTNRDPRLRSFPTARRVRAQYGRRAARRDGKFTMPTRSWWQRLWLPTQAFGVRIGDGVTPRCGALWVSANRKLRIIARSNWGKSHRLLIPIIRSLTGAAVVCSVEPDIFLSSVAAREQRWPDGFRRRLPKLRRRTWPHQGPKWLPRLVWPQKSWYPVYVVEVMPEAHKRGGDYPTIRWNPIPGCEDHDVAKYRGHALIKGVEAAGGTDNETARFFETSAGDAMAAYLHAAALDPTIELEDILQWSIRSDISAPAAILRVAEAAEMASMEARANITKHLDPKVSKTTGGVERYLIFALTSLVSEEGRKFTGRRDQPGQFDMEQLVRDEGTLYVLAEPKKMATIRPLLSLFVSEVAYAAENLAKSLPKQRLPRSFYLVLDEFRFGPRVANLPYISNVLRKNGLMYVYAMTNGGDEEELYTPSEAMLLRGQATTLIGGYDEASAPGVVDRAGPVSVITANRSFNGNGESPEQRDAIGHADMQEMEPGKMVVLGDSVRPFYAYAKLTYEQRRVRRQIAREVKEITHA